MVNECAYGDLLLLGLLSLQLLIQSRRQLIPLLLRSIRALTHIQDTSNTSVIHALHPSSRRCRYLCGHLTRGGRRLLLSGGGGLAVSLIWFLLCLGRLVGLLLALVVLLRLLVLASAGLLFIPYIKNPA